MKICIDPGHGGYDPGAVNHNVGVTEKSLALKIAALLGDFLGVPDVVLIDAMIFEVIFGIFASAGNQTMLLMDLILQSDEIGLLDRKLLIQNRRNKRK